MMMPFRPRHSESSTPSVDSIRRDDEREAPFDAMASAAAELKEFRYDDDILSCRHARLHLYRRRA